MIYSPACRQEPSWSYADNVFQVTAPVHLSPASGGSTGGGAGEVSLLVRLAVDIRFFNSSHQILAAPDGVLPLEGKANLLCRNALGAGQTFAAAVGRDRREGLIEILTTGIGAQLKVADFGRVPVAAEIQFANRSAVVLQRRPVMP